MEPIAVIGISCRLPGKIDSPSKLWDLLKDGKSTRSKIPLSRFNADGFYEPEAAQIGGLASVYGHFLDGDIRSFENSFFGINNLEATYMDPEQRQLLEVVYECLENAGIPLESVAGEAVGCYVGNFTYDFLEIQNKDPDFLHRYSGRGMSSSILANRVNHIFDFRGPSVVLDTACSSALYALHMACNDLSSENCSAAIVAGVNLIQSPEQYISIAQAGLLSPTGASHSFDASADGYARGEAVSALLLKPLNQALKHGDPVRAIVRGTAVNSNGRTLGITLPSPDGQELVVRRAYARAGLPLEPDYVECHATGTSVGDSIEVQGLYQAFRPSRNRPLLLGSVKPNLGHSEGASAISSIIKVILAMEHGIIPATIGVSNPHSNLKLDERSASIVTSDVPWPESPIRRASINSFGFGGANAHVVLEAFNKSSVKQRQSVMVNGRGEDGRKAYLVPLAAKQTSSLIECATKLEAMGTLVPQISDLAYTLGMRRSKLDLRGYFIVRESFVQEDLALSRLKVPTESKKYDSQPLGFVFTGQGTQWAGMGAELIKESARFRSCIEYMDAVLSKLPAKPEWSLNDLLQSGEDSMIESPSYAQPLCTAVQVGLVDVLREWNIYPQRVLGHSSGRSQVTRQSIVPVLMTMVGEIAAAYTAGAISTDEAIVAAFYRGLCASRTQHGGAMVSIDLSSDQALKRAKDLGLGESVQAACMNSHQNTTVSGEIEAVRSLTKSLKKEGIKAQILRTGGVAYHSNQMQSVARSYQSLLESYSSLSSERRSSSGSVTWISSVTTQAMSANTACAGPAYWSLNMTSPVLFSKAVKHFLPEHGMDIVQIGPHPSLGAVLEQNIQHLNLQTSKYRMFSSLSRGHHSFHCVLNLLGDLHIYGHDVPFHAINNPNLGLDAVEASRRAASYQPQALTDLPPYSWNRDTSLWVESRASAAFRSRSYPRHEILGSQIPDIGGSTYVWRNLLRVKDVDWLRSHQVGGSIVFPAAGYIAMAIEAIRQINKIDVADLESCLLENIQIVKALVLVDDERGSGVEINTTFFNQQEASDPSIAVWQFQILSHVGDLVTLHAKGSITLNIGTPKQNDPVSTCLLEQKSESAESWYTAFSKAGLDFGPHFRSLDKVHSGNQGCARFVTAWADSEHYRKFKRGSAYVLHPTTIDGILHTGLIATASSPDHFKLRIPISVGNFRFRQRGSAMGFSQLRIQGSARPLGLDLMDISVTATSEVSDKLYVRVTECQIRQPLADLPVQKRRAPLHCLIWKPDIEVLHERCVRQSASQVKEKLSLIPDTGVSQIQAINTLLGLFTHKFPVLRILLVGGMMSEIEDLVRKYKERYTGLTYKTQCFEQLSNEKSENDNTSHNKYNLIIRSQQTHAGSCRLARILESDNGWILDCVPKEIAPTAFQTSYVLGPDSGTVVALRRWESAGIKQAPYRKDMAADLIFIHTAADPLADAFHANLLIAFEKPISRVALSELGKQNFSRSSIAICAIEISKPLLASISPQEWQCVQSLADRIPYLIWLTAGNWVSGISPEHALATSLSRTIMSESPATRFAVLNIDEAGKDIPNRAQNITSIVYRIVGSVKPDLEYNQLHGVLHISRFIPSHALNAEFCSKAYSQTFTAPLSDAKPWMIGFSQPGQLSSLYIERRGDFVHHLDPFDVEIDTKCFGLGAASKAILMNERTSKDGWMALLSGGTVVRTGSQVSRLACGERVAALSPVPIQSNTTIPEWCCVRLQNQEPYATVFAALLNCSMAICGLQTYGQINVGESVLVRSNSSNLVLCAIKIAQGKGVLIHAVVASPSQASQLRHLTGSHSIFSCDDPSLLPAVNTATRNKGFDLVVNYISEELDGSLRKLCSPFTRQVHIDMEGTSGDRGSYYANLDLTTLFATDSTVFGERFSDLIENSLTFFRSGGLESIVPPKMFDVIDMENALGDIDCTVEGDMICLSTDNKSSLTKQLYHQRYESKFSPDKVYLMVGCLGGLGRSIARHMHSRGAKRFVFVSRSGISSGKTQSFVDSLVKGGASVSVAKGDVSNFDEINSIISSIDGPIGGVVQAAMTPNEALFSSMTVQQWHHTLRSKVQGTWNLHGALSDRDSELDFFLMTSSLAGSIGVATEANYSAANQFLDAFARFRRRQGLQATSLALGMISEVGYLHEHGVKSALEHYGLALLSEEDFIDLIDLAISSSKRTPAENSYDELASSHLITGLELVKDFEYRRNAFSSTLWEDPRLSYVLSSLPELEQSLDGIPEDTLEKVNSASKTTERVLDKILQHFSAIFATPLDEIDADQSLTIFGMDSVLATNVRAWLLQSFKTDVPSMTLVSQSITARQLAEMVGHKDDQ